MLSFRIISTVAQEHRLPLLQSAGTQEGTAVLDSDATDVGLIEVDGIEAEGPTQVVFFILESKTITDGNFRVIAGITLEMSHLLCCEWNRLSICIGKKTNLVFWKNEDTYLQLVVGITEDVFWTISECSHDSVCIIGRGLRGCRMQ